MGLIPWSPLSGGLLAGALKKVGEGRRDTEYMRGEIEANRSKLEPWEALCADLGEDPAHVALAWLLHQPAVTAPSKSKLRPPPNPILGRGLQEYAQ